MELRLLLTEYERMIFGDRLTQARAKRGMKFREKPRSRLAKIQLAFGTLYGLFETEADPVELMIAGIAMHDLEMFPQTCPRPDLSDLPPATVLECSDLWSLRKGAGLFAWCGVAVPAMLQQTQAVLAYLAADPENIGFYVGAGFVTAGEPVRYPYLETLAGDPILAQPMVIEGNALHAVTAGVSKLVIGTSADHTIIRLADVCGPRPSVGRSGLALAEWATTDLASPPAISPQRSVESSPNGPPSTGQ